MSYFFVTCCMIPICGFCCLNCFNFAVMKLLLSSQSEEKTEGKKKHVVDGAQQWLESILHVTTVATYWRRFSCSTLRRCGPRFKAAIHRCIPHRSHWLQIALFGHPFYLRRSCGLSCTVEAAQAKAEQSFREAEEYLEVAKKVCVCQGCVLFVVFQRRWCFPPRSSWYRVFDSNSFDSRIPTLAALGSKKKDTFLPSGVLTKFMLRGLHRKLCVLIIGMYFIKTFPTPRCYCPKVAFRPKASIRR